MVADLRTCLLVADEKVGGDTAVSGDAIVSPASDRAMGKPLGRLIGVIAAIYAAVGRTTPAGDREGRGVTCLMVTALRKG